MRYKTKPVEIEAVKWEATEKSWQEIKSMGCDPLPGEMGSESFFIETLEGKMRASKGDYIIKGLKGEFYPCKPDIFEIKYELIN